MTQRAVGDGRKSFDDPDNRTSSVADQEMFARTYAERNGLEFVSWHGDDGITGATMERPGLRRVLDAIREGAIDAVIIEDVDRLSRDQEHFQYMSKLFRVHHITLHTVAAGVIDHLVLSVKGMIGEQQWMRIAYTTRRGLAGKAKRGGATGGKTLGYGRAVDPGDSSTDRLVLVESEARLVAGSSRSTRPATVSSRSASYSTARASSRHVPASAASIMAGSGTHRRCRAASSLARASSTTSFISAGASSTAGPGSRCARSSAASDVSPRLNPEAEWMVRDEPDLRIIDDTLWQQVKQPQAEARVARDAQWKLTANPLSGAKRPAHLLSGLVACGTCGGPFVRTGGRWRCKAAMLQACTSSSIQIAELEDRVLAGVREHLLTPALIARFTAALQQELDTAHRSAHADCAGLEERRVEVRGRIDRLARRIEEGELAPRTLLKRLRDLDKEDGDLIAARPTVRERSVVRVPANYEVFYARAVAELETHLAPSDGSAAREAVRALIEKVVVQTRDARGGKRRVIQLHGALFAMLALAEEATVTGHKRKQPRSVRTGAVVTPLVAGTGHSRNQIFP